MTVRFSVKGVNLCRLLTSAANSGIKLRGATVEGLNLCVEIQGKYRNTFIKLLKNGGYEYSAVCEKGFGLKRAVSRIGLLVGALAVIIASFFYSKYIFFIKVTGYDAPGKVLELLERNGIEHFCLKKAVREDELERVLIDKLNVSIADVKIDGATLVVSLKEEIKAGDISALPSYSQVFSDYDCVITRIVTISGTPVVENGQAVKKGSVLIDAFDEIAGERRNENAVGEVFGKVYYRKDAVIPDTVPVAVRTGNFYVFRTVEIFGKVAKFQVPYLSYEVEKRYYYISDLLPIKSVEYTVYETVMERVKNESFDEEAESGRILNELSLEFPAECNVLNSWHEITVLSDTKILTVYAEVEQKVGGKI